MSEQGHNSGVKSLENFANRIERLKDEKAVSVAEFNEDIKQVRAEAKSAGYNLKALDAVLRIRAMDEADRADIEIYAGELRAFG